MRGSTKINTQPSPGARLSGSSVMWVSHHSDQNSTPDGCFIATVDSPNTTSQITYSLGFQHTGVGSPLYTNGTKGASNSLNFEATTSEIIAMEIVG